MKGSLSKIAAAVARAVLVPDLPVEEANVSWRWLKSENTLNTSSRANNIL
ncbi:MAG: hypothetical protein QXZ25_00460 [Candidatus Bathyarchaeia archaeon]